MVVGEDEHLGLAGQPAEGGGVQDAVAVALEAGAQRVRLPPSRRRRPAPRARVAPGARLASSAASRARGGHGAGSAAGEPAWEPAVARARCRPSVAPPWWPPRPRARSVPWLRLSRSTCHSSAPGYAGGRRRRSGTPRSSPSTAGRLIDRGRLRRRVRPQRPRWRRRRGLRPFRREGPVVHGGPDGGDGGKGGDVWLVADRNVASLLAFRDHPHRRATNGAHGQGKDQHGQRGDDLEVHVPEGTVVKRPARRPSWPTWSARRPLAGRPRRAGWPRQRPLPAEPAAGAELRRAGRGGGGALAATRAEADGRRGARRVPERRQEHASSAASRRPSPRSPTTPSPRSSRTSGWCGPTTASSSSSPTSPASSRAPPRARASATSSSATSSGPGCWSSCSTWPSARRDGRRASRSGCCSHELAQLPAGAARTAAAGGRHRRPTWLAAPTAGGPALRMSSVTGEGVPGRCVHRWPRSSPRPAAASRTARPSSSTAPSRRGSRSTRESDARVPGRRALGRAGRGPVGPHQPRGARLRRRPPQAARCRPGARAGRRAGRRHRPHRRVLLRLRAGRAEPVAPRSSSRSATLVADRATWAGSTRGRSPSLCAGRPSVRAGTATRWCVSAPARSSAGVPPRPRRSGPRPPHAPGGRGGGPEPADGDLERSRLADHGLVAAQVLLVPHDFVEPPPVPARPPDAGAAAGAGVRAGRQRERRDRRRRDPLRRQRPHRRPRRPPRRRRPAGAAHRHGRLFTADPAARSAVGRAHRVDVAADDRAGVVAGGAGSARGSGGHGVEADRGPHRVVVGGAGGDRRGGSARRRCATRARRAPGSARRSSAHERRLSARKLWIAFAVRRHGHRRGRRRRPPGARSSATRRCCPPASPRCAATSTRATRWTCRSERRGVRPGHGGRRRQGAAGAPSGRRTTTCRPTSAHEVVHRDDLVVRPSGLSRPRPLVRRFAGESPRSRRGTRRREPLWPALRVMTLRPRPSPAGRAGGGSRPPASGPAAPLEAELGAQLREPGLRLDVRGGLLDLEHAALDRRLVELGHALGLGVAGLDLVADLVERRDVLADGLDSEAIALFICSCILAWSSWPMSFCFSASFCCSIGSSAGPPPWPGRTPGSPAGRASSGPRPPARR